MRTKLLIIIGIFYTSLSMGQVTVQTPERSIRIGLGATASGYLGLNTELILEADISSRWYVSARLATSFWRKDQYIYLFRRGVHYKLLNYKGSYFSIGLDYLNARIKNEWDSRPMNVHAFEMPLSLNLSVSNRFMIEAGVAFSTLYLNEGDKLGEADMVLRLGAKYRIHR